MVFQRCRLAAYKAILTFIPDLHVRTWTRNWKPFCDALVDVCWKEERHADNFKKRPILKQWRQYFAFSVHKT
jgi:hypothetical protein